ncbi:hypothetical protein GCM10026987_34330 [Belliella aquatica]|uniref:Por secretion system C-terminal sorting domain-containing protein n=2 Tax=Belliella aquatica TaxID=1323734 RepID=A0ABQ1M4B4_9BACT|nr:hypothetical protein GCM10010993_07820 [Belliella aquatica]
MQEEALGIYGSRDYFESWMSGKIEEISKKPSIQNRVKNERRVIPVVVHIIHNGTAIGEEANIPLSQITAQIRTLNEDFRRQNPDQNLTPIEFASVAADANIEFVLAKVDPNGLPTSGIVRVQGPQSVYSPNDAPLISSISSWPSEDYLNMWVLPITPPFIGYATFPVSDLPGLNFSPSSREVDGVTMDYRYFGEGGNAVAGSRGRTTTHEVGHFLGLRHIWGDANTGQDGCSVDDFVADTPNQDSDNNNCRINNPRFSCGSRDMTENYMDYTPDACMNLFTRGQVGRMNVVLEFSPRRGSLINNFATIDPQVPDLDLSIENIINPQDLLCSNTLVPQVELLNRGLNVINTARIQISFGGNVLETRDFNLNLSLGERATVSFNSINIPGDGQALFEARVLLVNESADENPSNNVQTTRPLLQPEINIPYLLDLSDSENDWLIRNPDASFTWENITLPISGVNQNLLWIRHYEYEGIGEEDFYISPSINLSEFPNAQLTFNMAHSPFIAAGFSDFLYVAVSTDCGNTFNIINAPYNKDSNLLQTIAPQENEFIPTSNNQFRREILNLSQFSDFDNIRIAFITQNGYGNNIFLKDIEILSEETYNYKIDLNRLVSPGPIHNGSQTTEVVEITNTGNLPINSFVLQRRTNNGSPQSFVARGQQLEVGQSINVEIPNSLVATGVSRSQYNLLFPNFDQNPGNESQLVQFTEKNENTIRAPWRQNFNQSTSLQPWSSININTNINTWSVIPVQSEAQNVVTLGNTSASNSNWLGSPVFDLSISSQASVFYSLAASNQSANTIFKVMASEDGGVTYTEVERKMGSEINTIASGIVNPNNRSEYRREFIDLNEFAGRGQRNVRIAFVVENGSQSNDPVYIDDIELYLSSNPEPVDPGLGNTVIFPNPAREVFNIAFNFATYENVNIQVISSSGTLVQDIDYPNTLNQTYSFSTQLFSKGVFIVKITSNSLTETRKLIIH